MCEKWLNCFPFRFIRMKGIHCCYMGQLWPCLVILLRATLLLVLKKEWDLRFVNAECVWRLLMTLMRRYIHFADQAYCTFHFDMTKICFLIQFRADQIAARDAASHKQHCERIEADSGRAGYSVTYGINRTSILIKAHHFDVTKCLPYYIMHTLFEGVAPYHLKLLLQNIINGKGYLTLQQLNQAFSVHCFGYSESDTKPSLIEQDRADSSTFHIRQSGT